MSANAGTSVPLRVLIVEDNRDARTTMRLLLTMAHGYAVHEAADGASGVQAALDARPDVALIDLGLPDVDGCEVAKRIRGALGAATVLVALTGYASDDDKRRAAAAGFDHYLVKPVHRPALLAIFDEIARAKRSAARAAREERS